MAVLASAPTPLPLCWRRALSASLGRLLPVSFLAAVASCGRIWDKTTVVAQSLNALEGGPRLAGRRVAGGFVTHLIGGVRMGGEKGRPH